MKYKTSQFLASNREEYLYEVRQDIKITHTKKNITKKMIAVFHYDKGESFVRQKTLLKN